MERVLTYINTNLIMFVLDTPSPAVAEGSTSPSRTDVVHAGNS